MISTRVTEHSGIRYPIICPPMAFVTTGSAGARNLDRNTGVLYPNTLQHSHKPLSLPYSLPLPVN